MQHRGNSTAVREIFDCVHQREGRGEFGSHFILPVANLRGRREGGREGANPMRNDREVPVIIWASKWTRKKGGKEILWGWLKWIQICKKTEIKGFCFNVPTAAKGSKRLRLLLFHWKMNQSRHQPNFKKAANKKLHRKKKQRKSRETNAQQLAEAMKRQKTKQKNNQKWKGKWSCLSSGVHAAGRGTDYT